MKKFFLRFLLYLIPLPVYVALIVAVDPFNYVGLSSWITEETKVNSSEKLNYALWKMIEYRHKKSTKIILGDSRSHKINTDHVRKLTGSEYYNFAYPGGGLLDMIETFWFADSVVKLEEVYMGINFNLYNDFEKNNDVRQTNAIMKNIFTYSFSKVVLTALIQNIRYQFFTKDLKIGNPFLHYDSFWKYTIDVIGNRFYQKYKHPDWYYSELQRISDHCNENNIKLVFFSPPNHVEWQQRVKDFNLEEEYRVFIDEISSLGTYINLDVSNEFTRRKDNFYDPMHPVMDSIIVYSLWGNSHNVNHL